MAATLAAYYQKIPVGHVEAGLRTGDIYSPWPEEVNRRVTSTIADLHFAPTLQARNNLLREGIQGSSVFVTGNTVIDALMEVNRRFDKDPQLHANATAVHPPLHDNLPLILVTGHRRESFGVGFQNICAAIRAIAESGAAEFVYPVHPNPSVREPISDLLGGCDFVHLVEPMGYVPFVALMKRCDIVLTDSGGIQEEAPALRKPVLVMRDTSERPESIEAGCARLVGTKKDVIERELLRLIGDPTLRSLMVKEGSPFGDGQASAAICQAIATHHQANKQPIASQEPSTRPLSELNHEVGCTAARMALCPSPS